MRLFAAFLIVTVGGCLPGGRCLAQLPQSTLPVAQCTLPARVEVAGCSCPAGGPCTCDATGCDCGAACACAACPGKAGVAPDPDSAIHSARLYGCPLVGFVGCPARPVAGAVSYHAGGTPGAAPFVFTGGADVGTKRPAGTADADLLKAAAPYVGAAPMPVAPAATYPVGPVSFGGYSMFRGGVGCSS